MRRFSATVSRSKIRRPSGACTIPAATIAAADRPTRSPANSIVPRVDRAAVLAEDPGDGPQQGRLAGAVAAQHRHHRARGHLQRDAPHAETVPP